MKSPTRKSSMKAVEGSGQARHTVAGLSQTLYRLLVMADRPILLRNMDNFQMATISPYVAAHPRGFLPLMVLAGNSIWADLGEPPYQVRLQDCLASLSGVELISVMSVHDNLDTLVLAIMEAISQATDDTGFTINGLGKWVSCGPPSDLVGANLAAVPASTRKAKKSPRKSR